MDLIYVPFALLSPLIPEEGNLLPLLLIFLGKLVKGEKNLKFSFIFILLGLLVLLDFKMFMQASSFKGSVYLVQSLLLFQVALALIIKNPRILDGYSILFTYFIIILNLNSDFNQTVVHSTFMGINYAAISIFYNSNYEFMVYLCGIIWILVDFKALMVKKIDVLQACWVICGILCDFRNLEESIWHCLASLIVSMGYIINEGNSLILIVFTMMGHLLWFLNLRKQQILEKEYSELPLSVKSASIKIQEWTKGRKLLKWLLFLSFAALSLVYNFRSYVFQDEISQKISDKEKPFVYVDITSQNRLNALDKFFKLDSGKEENNCDVLFGHSFIKNFKNSKTTVCPAKENMSTNIDCYFHAGRRGVSGIEEEVFCEIKNYFMDLKLIKDFKFPVNSKLEFWNMPHIQKSTRGTCQLNLSSVKERVHSEQPSAFLLNSFTHAEKLQCQEYFNKTVLFVSRWDTTNQYHATEDFLQAWVTMLVADIDPRNTVVVRLDTKAMGPFTSFFNYALSNKAIPRIEKTDLQATTDLINIVDWAQKMPTACFSRAVFGIFAVPSPVSFHVYSLHPSPTSCRPPDTQIFTSFKDFMIDTFNFLPDSQLPIRKEVHVTFISRKGVLREIKNEDKLLKTISETVCGNPEKCELVLEVFDFQKLTFYQQLSVARNADILLGMHGAALTSAIYLRSTAALIEIGHPSRSGNQHFNNLARYMGLRYRYIDGDDLLSDSEIEAISKAVKEEVEHNLQLKV